MSAADKIFQIQTDISYLQNLADNQIVNAMAGKVDHLDNEEHAAFISYLKSRIEHIKADSAKV